MVKFRKVFAPHANHRFNEVPLEELAGEVVYVCASPMFDDYVSDEFSQKFEGKITKAIEDFDPETDIIADFGDSIVFAMLVYRVAMLFDKVKIARFSKKKNGYIVRELSDSQFLQFEAPDLKD